MEILRSSYLRSAKKTHHPAPELRQRHGRAKRPREPRHSFAERYEERRVTPFGASIRDGAVWNFPMVCQKIDHAIALVEMLERVDLEPDAEHLPLEFQGTPITYLSLNDFLNLATSLRTSSELLQYLDARRSLPSSDLRVIGDERSLFECYFLEGPFLKGAKSRADATTIVARQQARLMATLAEKRESDRYSTLLEHVADELAVRLSGYAVNLPKSLLAHFDPPDARSGYLKMQGVLAGLRLRERAKLGEAFYEVIWG